MGERYWITGAQLGTLISIRESSQRKKIVEDIEDKQFICDIENNQMKDFAKEVEEFGEKFMEKENE